MPLSSCCTTIHKHTIDTIHDVHYTPQPREPTHILAPRKTLPIIAFNIIIILYIMVCTWTAVYAVLRGPFTIASRLSITLVSHNRVFGWRASERCVHAATPSLSCMVGWCVRVYKYTYMSVIRALTSKLAPQASTQLLRPPKNNGAHRMWCTYIYSRPPMVYALPGAWCCLCPGTYAVDAQECNGVYHLIRLYCVCVLCVLSALAFETRVAICCRCLSPAGDNFTDYIPSTARYGICGGRGGVCGPKCARKVGGSLLVLAFAMILLLLLLMPSRERESFCLICVPDAHPKTNWAAVVSVVMSGRVCGSGHLITY